MSLQPLAESNSMSKCDKVIPFQETHEISGCLVDVMMELRQEVTTCAESPVVEPSEAELSAILISGLEQRGITEPFTYKGKDVSLRVVKKMDDLHVCLDLIVKPDQPVPKLKLKEKYASKV